ncbi:YqaJ viral recombinase family protein [Staphylococcus equorum]|uniref:YqaJ viral recombinase family nuclease n=1 Tax=Staphylococcus equorum TaxID=246432 RepID=UPI001F5456A0|nr:YqaJ viral recombinase family protein [Staphylococcus equorum]
MNNNFINTKDMSNKEWLAHRQTGIGGSDVGVILGVNKWKSPIQLYFEKIGEVKEPVLDNEYIYWGNVLEDIVAQEFSKRTGKKVRRVNKMFRHPKYDFMIANIDRSVVGEDALLECKTTSEYNKDKWQDEEIPSSYLAQVQHYLAVTGYKKGYIAVLIGGNRFVWKEIERDEDLINLIIDKEKEFWERYILGEELPDMDGSNATTEFLKHKYLESLDSEKILNNDIETTIEALNAVKEEEKEIKTLKQKYENKLKATLGNEERGMSKNFKVSWKMQNKKSFDKKAFEKDYPDLANKYTKESKHRVLRIKELNH